MEEYIISFVISVIASLLALYITIFCGRPRLQISPDIVCSIVSTQRGVVERYRIKLLNKSRIWNIYNIKIFEYYHFGPDNYYMAPIKTIPYLKRHCFLRRKRPKIRGISAILREPVRMTTSCVQKQTVGEFLNSDQSYYAEIVVICSTRSFGGTKGVFKQRYALDSIKKNHRFVDTSLQTCKIESE